MWVTDVPQLCRYLNRAEAGGFTDAIAAAQRTLPLAVADGNETLATDLRNNIDNYRQKIPVRDPSLIDSNSVPR